MCVGGKVGFFNLIKGWLQNIFFPSEDMGGRGAAKNNCLLKYKK